MAKDVGKILAKTALQSRSDLYRWLHAHYAQLAPVMNTKPKPSWEALAKTAGESGLKQPTRQGVRKAWLRVEQDIEAAGTPPTTPVKSKTKPLTKVPPSPDRQPPVATSSPTVADGADDHRDVDLPSPHTFRPAKIR